MLKRIIQSGYISYVSDANRVAYVLEHIPFIRSKVVALRSEGRKLNGFGIAGIILRLIWEIIKKAAFVAVFMLLPRYVLTRVSADGAIGFGLENCFVYFTVVMVCFCGSINNSAVFELSETSYTALREAKCRPSDYFRMVLVRKNISELISYWVVFTVFGMNFVKSFYLAIVIICARYDGEAFNILLFRATGKPFAEHKGGNVTIMLISLFLAYFIPYMRGHVPGAYDLIFDTIWLMVILSVAAVFIYYVWNYSGYGKVAARIFKRSNFLSEDDRDILSDRSDKPEDYVCNFDAYDEDSYKNVNKEFFRQNRATITGAVEMRIVAVIIILAVAIIVAFNGYKDAVAKVISYSMPVLVFVMCVFSNSFGICKSLFYQCDCRLLENEDYRRRNDILENFFIRLKYLIVIDLIPAVMLAGAYAIAGAVAGKDGSTITVVSVCVGIILLSCLFTVLNLTLYYIIQPYKGDVQKGARICNVINVIMYICCAGFIYINSTALLFTLGVGLALAIILAVAVTLVRQVGNRTFRLK